MNQFFKNIKEIAKKYINYIKANNVKKKILENYIDSEDNADLEQNSIDTDVITILLKDVSVIDKLYEDKTLLYYVSLLEEDEQLNFLNNHIEIFKEDINNVYAMALKNISIEKLLKTELGTRVIDAFPRECYKKIEDLGEDKLKEINSKIDTDISLYDIAYKIFDREKNHRKILSFLNENIAIKDKISVLKNTTKWITHMSNIIDSTMDDNEKIEVINNLNVSTSIDELINLNMSDELRNYLLDRVSDNDYISFVNDIFSVKLSNLRPYYVERIMKAVSRLGKERITLYLSSEQMQKYSFITELVNNFDKEQIQALLPGGGSNYQFLEMNFLDKYPIMIDSYFGINNLLTLNNSNGELFRFRNYHDFRDQNNGLDFCESIYKSLYEYGKYGNLYNDIINNFQKLSDEEKIDFKDRWNELMNLDNKFEIKNIHDFQRIDEIEKEYYSKILKESNSNSEIKQAISEILVRNGNIYNITKLGNGTEYSMKNKLLEDIVDLLTTINEITDQQALKGILNDCIGMIGSEELKRIRKIGRNIEEKIIQEYREGYIESFTNYDEMSDEELAKIEGIDVQRINGIRIIELKGANFAFLSHSGGITGEHRRCCCSQITDDNFSTFDNGLNYYTYIYSKFSPRRIKIINLGDAGCSDYRNTYISSNDLRYSTQSCYLGSFNEVTLSTKNEKGDNGLQPSAIMTNKSVNSSEFSKIIEDLKNMHSMPKTIYVLYQDIYYKKNKQEIFDKEEGLKRYLKTLDPKLLNLVLYYTHGRKESMSLLMDEIKKYISVHMDEQVGKSKLRRNVTRYWQLSRGKDNRLPLQLPYAIMDELQKELEKMDNEFLMAHSIKDRVKEVSDDYYKYEH